MKIYGVLALPARWDPRTQNAVDINEDQLPSWPEYWKLYKEGKWRDMVGSRPAVPALEPLVVKHYPVNSMRIPDQIRGDVFLALGPMVEGITRSRFWPESLILIVEDDAQDGLDHVDGHRRSKRFAAGSCLPPRHRLA